MPLPFSRRPHRLERLWQPVARDLGRFAWRLTGDASLAEDLLQDALVTAMRKLPQLQEDGAFRAWMARIVYRTWLDRRPPRPETWTLIWTDVDRAQRTAAVPGPEDRLVARRIGEAIEDAVERLPEGQRVVLELIDHQGFTFAEAAAALDLSPGTVASRLARARAALRTSLAEVAATQGVRR